MRLTLLLLSLALAGCGDSSLTDTLLSNPRVDREGQCSTDKDFSGRGLPFHTLPIDNGNDFNTQREAFQTSTPDAQTPYVAYASWDPCHLYFGYTGSALGAGDCPGTDGENCEVHDLAENAYTYLLLYIDTDPTTDQGTDRPKQDRGPTPAKLPFRADYLIEIRTDGETIQKGDGYTYQGNAQLLQRKSGWQAGLEKEWVPVPSDPLTIGDNSSSNFIEFSVPRVALGDPCAVQVVGWVVETRKGEAWAYWPPPRHAARAARPDSMRADSSRADTPDSRPDSSASGATRVASSNRTGRSDSTKTEQRPGERTANRADSLVLDYYGFVLLSEQQPNARANLNRSDYSDVRQGCNAPPGSERSALPAARPVAPWALAY